MQPSLQTIGRLVHLERIAPHHAPALFSAIDANREHLGAFLPWVPQMAAESDVSRYIQRCVALQRDGSEESFVIFSENELVGRIGLHHIDAANRTASIGYWLTSSVQGRGIASQACRNMLELGFGKKHLYRIEIKAAVANERSNRIPKALGFVHEGTLRSAEWVRGQAVDVHLYAMLAPDWVNPIHLV